MSNALSIEEIDEKIIIVKAGYIQENYLIDVVVKTRYLYLI